MKIHVVVPAGVHHSFWDYLDQRLSQGADWNLIDHSLVSPRKTSFQEYIDSQPKLADDEYWNLVFQVPSFSLIEDVEFLCHEIRHGLGDVGNSELDVFIRV